MAPSYPPIKACGKIPVAHRQSQFRAGSSMQAAPERREKDEAPAGAMVACERAREAPRREGMGGEGQGMVREGYGYDHLGKGSHQTRLSRGSSQNHRSSLGQGGIWCVRLCVRVCVWISRPASSSTYYRTDMIDTLHQVRVSLIIPTY